MQASGRLEGRAAIVTGGAQGIGRGIAERFAREGARVVIADISQQAQITVDYILAAGGRAVWIATDVGQSQPVQALIEQTVAAFGRLDILVNNAAVQHLAPLWALPEDQFDQMVATNLRGCYLCARYAIPVMLEQGKGCLINLASNLALRALPGFTGYSATKGGIEAFSRALALECAPHGIRVNCICPGTTVTPILDPILAQFRDPEAVLAAAARQMPIGRLGQPEDVAALAAFLASDEAEMVVGATLVADGGASLRLASYEAQPDQPAG